MARLAYRFDRFELEPEDRRLTRDGTPVELSARYLDALALMVAEEGRLVTKDRFLAEVWKGVPVTDEALTQCVRSLRRALGDDAARPRLIETVPKHGYRFVAPVTRVEGGEKEAERAGVAPTAAVGGDDDGAAKREALLRFGRAGTLGGGAAGALGGLVYGAMGLLGDGDGGAGVSGLLVMTCLTAVVGLAGGAGVGFGIGASVFAERNRAAWTVVGGLLGGLAVGAVVRLLGLDAFDLLFGQAPGAITGALEGAALGAAVGLGAALTRPGWSVRRKAALAAIVGGLGGALIALGGGRLMAGSLETLAAAFPQSRLRLEPIGAVFGEVGLGPVGHAVASGLEAMLFSGCVVAALAVAGLGRGPIAARPGA